MIADYIRAYNEGEISADELFAVLSANILKGAQLEADPVNL